MTPLDTHLALVWDVVVIELVHINVKYQSINDDEDMNAIQHNNIIPSQINGTKTMISYHRHSSYTHTYH
jgi:hypothetical protein